MPRAPQTERTRGFKLDRLSAISDGIIAIAMTLLVLGIEVPTADTVDRHELTAYLERALHPALGFVLSFVLIGMYWLQHYTIFHYLTRATRMLVVLNSLFLLCLSFLPFPTDLQATFPDSELALMLYGAAQLLCGLTLLVVWLYASSNRRLVGAHLQPRVARHMTRRLLIAPGLCLVAIGVATVDLTASRLILLSIPFFYLSGRAIESEFRLPDASTDDAASS